jgi:glycosyltransferase involved in cell wall biosynthesis
MLPGVSVLIPTYNRANIVRGTVAFLNLNLLYDGPVTFIVGVDGDDNTAETLNSIRLPGGRGLVVLDGPRRQGLSDTGLGANLNMLMAASQDDIVIQMDDDHHLVSPLNITPHVKHLTGKSTPLPGCKSFSSEAAGWIRLMGVGFHSYTATLRGMYWYVHWDSVGEYSLYIPSNRPHIKHRRFHKHYGKYPVNMKLGETEEAFCHQCRNKANEHVGDRWEIPHVLVPLNSQSETAWKHVGHSFQTQGE